MDRKEFLKLMAILPLSGAMSNVKILSSLGDSLKNTDLMPVLFVGHGSPMNAIEENEFVNGWRKMGQSIPKPKAIICVSAHWETKGTYITAMPKPRTIHDFGGFPKELFQTQYPAAGSPEIALETKNQVTKTSIGLDEKWGLDHGCWSILKPMFPEADIPVIQMSLDYSKPPQYHYELARELAFLRRKGVLIIGSGNMVHNLRMIAWDKVNESEYGFEWAKKASNLFKDLILKNDHNQLIKYDSLGKEVAMSVPSPDHYLPLLYSLALKGEKEDIHLFNDKEVMGSISMTSLKIG